MHARITRLDAPAGNMRDGIAVVHSEVIPAVKGLDGFVGAYFLGDRETGQVISITLWESEKAMRRSEEAANTIRSDTASRTERSIDSVERYEVVAQV